jgi:hypothetical protein
MGSVGLTRLGGKGKLGWRFRIRLDVRITCQDTQKPDDRRSLSGNTGKGYDSDELMPEDSHSAGWEQTAGHVEPVGSELVDAGREFRACLAQHFNLR